MKKWLALALAIAAPSGLACTGGRTIRVHFYDCGAIDDGKGVAVRIGGAAGESITLHYIDKYTWEGKLTNQAATDKSEIEIDGNPAVCCKRPKVVPLQKPSRDCAVEYVVSCDLRTPGWALSARSDLGDVTFEFDPEHPDNFRKPACVPTAFKRDTTGISNLGEHDIVLVRVYRNKDLLVTFPIDLQQFKSPEIPVSKEILESWIDQQAGDSQYGPEAGLKELHKAQLPPNGVTVVRR